MHARLVSPTERVVFFKSLPWLRMLDVQRAVALAEYAEERIFRPGQTIVAEAAAPTQVYFLRSGQARMWWEGVHIRSPKPSDTIGFEGLLMTDGAAGRVVAHTECATLAIEADILLDTLESNPDLVLALFRRFANRGLDLRQRLPIPAGTNIVQPPHRAGLTQLTPVDRMRILYQTPLARNNFDSILPLARSMQEHRWPAGHELWPVGAPARRAVFQLAGRVRCEPADGDGDGDGDAVRLSGSCSFGFDEMWTGQGHAYRAVAETDVHALTFEHSQVATMVENHFGIARGVLGAMLSSIVISELDASSESQPHPDPHPVTRTLTP